ncbi:MAG: thermonuclease family protein [Nitrospinae bacterium]|nr:thermonuclease family protein [Nitrospinota bacterium]
MLIFSLTFTLPAYGEAGDKPPRYDLIVYKWVDEDGTVNFADTIDKIPERYRKSAEKKNLPPSGISFSVRHIIDGDTIITTSGEKIRFLGIDAPEVASEKMPAQFFSEEAKMANKNMLDGKTIRLEFDIEKIDKYGRLLAYIFLKDGTFVNAKLIEDGDARAYCIPPNVKYYSRFKKLEKEAIKNRKGLWSEPDSIAPIPHSDAIRHIGKFRFVEGVVRSIHNTGKAVHLNFGNNPDEDFTVTIFDRDYQRFREKGIDPSGYYEGKTVAVYGKIKLYRGAEIVVSFPEDIAVTDR